MTTTVHQDGPVATVVVTHDPRQSYSRAVLPRAHRAARTALRGTWTVEDVDYDSPAPPVGRAVTVVTYTRL